MPHRSSHALVWLRYVVPAAVCVAGVVIVVVAGSQGYGPHALSALVGAGASIYLINRFLRIAIEGEADRDVDEARRLFLDRYGMWPDEAAPDWRPPDGYPDARAAFAAILDERRKDERAA